MLNSQPTEPDYLKRDLRDCRTSENELSQALEDLQYMQLGKQIYYAVDFSEILPYVLPERQGSQGLLLFLPNDQVQTEEDKRLIQNHQQFILKQIFNNESHSRLILLPPYAVELDSLWATLQSQNLQSYYRRVTDLLVYGTKPSELRQLVDLAESFLEKKMEFDSDEFKAWTSLLFRNVPHLINVLKGQKPISQERVRILFENKVFVDLEEVIDIDVAEFNNMRSLVDLIRQHLLNTRTTQNEAAAHLDAVAMDMVGRINQLLRNKKRDDIKLILITRSVTMQAVAQNLELQHCILRHPRVIGLIGGMLSQKEWMSDPLAAKIQDLEQRREKIRSIFNLIPDGISLSEISLGKRKQVEEHLREIKNYWLSTEVIASAEDIDLQKIDTQLAQEIANVLHDPQEWQRLIKNTLDALIDQIEEGYVPLRMYIPGAEEGFAMREHFSLQLVVDNKRHHQTVMLKGTSQLMPHTLQFYSDEARRRISDAFPSHSNNVGQLVEATIPLRALRNMSLGNLARFLQKNLASDNLDNDESLWGYERLLLLAFICSVSGSWESAEAYCNSAIEKSLAIPDEYRRNHESYFFSAICKRKYNPSIERYQAALEDLQLAISLKNMNQQRDTGRVSDDPRYLKEKATIILLAHLEILARLESAKDYQWLPDGETALSLLEQAENICRMNSRSDEILLIQIINNKLIYYLDYSSEVKKYIPDINKRRDELHELETLQRNQDYNERIWPAALLDTLAYAEWRLASERTRELCKKVQRRFNLALRSPQVSNDREREGFIRHHELFLNEARISCSEEIDNMNKY